jgi:hypothetical protein
LLKNRLFSFFKIACHKFNPSGEAGAMNAMHDAVILANYIDALSNCPTVDEIEKAFLAYRSDRIQWVGDVFEQSKLFRTMVDKVRIEWIMILFTIV